MKIKLISPRTCLRPMDSLWKTRMAPPISLLVLSALTPKHHQISMVDENIRKNDFNDNPDLVGITVKVDTFCRAAEIASKYRSRGIPVVVGGVHATAVPEQCAEIADAVVIGEGETLWPRLLREFENGIPLKQFYRNETPVDISTVPVPDWSLLQENNYLFTNTLRIGRGCPWTCGIGARNKACRSSMPRPRRPMATAIRVSWTASTPNTSRPCSRSTPMAGRNMRLTAGRWKTSAGVRRHHPAGRA